MKSKSLLLALACFAAGVLTAHPVRQTVTTSIATLINRANHNRAIADMFYWDDYSAGFFRGKAEALEQVAAGSPR